MNSDAAIGFLILLVVFLIWIWIRGHYPLEDCSTCDGSGREYQDGTRHFRICRTCHGQKVLIR